MEQNTFLSNTIGIVVAIIVAAAVLVPICNSITDNGGSGGSGGSGDYEVINALHSYQGGFDKEITIPSSLKSYQVYDNSHNPTMPSYSLTRADLVQYMNNIGMQADYRDGLVNLPLLRINVSNFSATINGETVSDDYLSISVYRMTGWASPQGSDLYYNTNNVEVSVGYGYSADVRYNWMLQTSEDEAHFNYDLISQFNLTVNSDYSISLTVVGSENSISISNVTGQIYMDYISENEVGWILTDVMGAELKIAEGSSLMGMGEHGLAVLVDDQPEVYYIYGAEEVEITSSDYVANGTISLSKDVQIGQPGWVFTEGWSFDVADSVIDPSSFNAEMTSSPDGVNVGQYYVNYLSLATSTINGNPYEAGTGGGSGGDGSIASTIIGIIPIFVILAILMGTAMMMYQKRQGL